MSKVEKRTKRRAVSKAAVEPVAYVWLSALDGYCDDPEVTARRVLEAASVSHRGAQCASCGRIVRRHVADRDMPYAIRIHSVGDDGCAVLTCSPLCTERTKRRGLRFVGYGDA